MRTHSRHEPLLASPPTSLGDSSLRSIVTLLRTNRGARRYLRHPDRRRANTFEAPRGGTTLWHDPVDRHVADSVCATSAAAPCAPLPRNWPPTPAEIRPPYS